MKKSNIFEHFIFLCIILVIIQTFLDDFSVMQKWNVEKRNLLLISGFVFDLIFSIEFLTRTISNSYQKKFSNYFWYRRGWVDFLSSIPLLLLNSGPSLYILLTGEVQQIAAGIGVLNVLKVIKAIRVTRILRLVRIVKIFGKIHNTDSPMAQHHTSVITTTAVFSVIISLIIFSSLFQSPLSALMDEKVEIYKHSIDSIIKIEKDNILTTKETAQHFFKNSPDILRVIYENEDIFPFDENQIGNIHSHEDIQITKYKGFTLYLSLLSVHSKEAFEHIQSFFTIILLVLAFSFLYTKHFAQSVSDILHILNRGMRKKDYNLQIKINKNYKDHEVYRLAQFYNDAYLPAKLKKSDKENSLSMNDLLKFNK